MSKVDKKILVNFAMPSKLYASIEADIVVIPGSEGVFGVMYGHVPLITNTVPGLVEVKIDSKKLQFFTDVSIVLIDNVSVNIASKFIVDLAKLNKDSLIQEIEVLNKKLHDEEFAEIESSNMLKARLAQAETLMKLV
jgi:F-type H+-transporting ATPase subunit epsilon